MSFRSEDLHDLAVAHEVRIETHTARDTTRSTIVWIVVDEGQVLVRSVLGARGRWYQEALANPNVVIDDSGRRLEARAVPLGDAASTRRVSEALGRKYPPGTGLDEMLEPEALTANLLLEARIDHEIALQGPANLGADEPSELGPPIDMDLLHGGPALEERTILQPRKPA